MLGLGARAGGSQGLGGCGRGGAGEAGCPRDVMNLRPTQPGFNDQGGFSLVFRSTVAWVLAALGVLGVLLIYGQTPTSCVGVARAWDPAPRWGRCRDGGRKPHPARARGNAEPSSDVGIRWAGPGSGWAKSGGTGC